METFVWNERFTTGLEAVDEQHHHLVDIVNLVGDILVAEHSSAEDMEAIFKQLADYARQHFATEEKLMAEVGVDPRHIASHKHHHTQFVEQVVRMWRSRGTMANPAETLHGFLTSWLSFHILDEDQSMARQIAAIRAGDSAEKAYAFEHRTVDNNVATLLDALHKLYHVLTLQNHDLAAANAGLEEKVAARTGELQTANERLAALLEKVESARNQILQSEKMAAIGQLAAGVAHEINNPIGFVNSNLGTLKNYVDSLLHLIDTYEQCEAEHGVQSEKLAAARREIDLAFLRTDIVALLGESHDGLERVKKIVQDLKDFSHVDASELQDADINAGLDSTLNVVWNELKYKTEVIKDYRDLPPVRCIASQLNQVFMNLLVNAGQAIERRGTITIRTGCEGDQVWIEIGDTGCGMPPDVAKRIFEPFFTTKPVGTGTGLGLSLAYDIVVKKHGGSIDVDSEPGKGTTFRIRIPIDPKTAT